MATAPVAEELPTNQQDKAMHISVPILSRQKGEMEGQIKAAGLFSRQIAIDIGSQIVRNLKTAFNQIE